MIPISLYIHLPWCIKKCPYCDFNAHPLKEEVDFEAYIKRLIEDLKQYDSILSERKLSSIFIGGGTPSLFNGKELLPLFKAISDYQSLDIEITIEANPGTQDFAHYQEYSDLGINRISLGAQSFNPTMLSHLGRIHSNDQIHDAIHIAKQHFKRINLDIMYGLPHQTTQEALDDLKTFLSYDLEHLSWYQLNIERNTLYYVKKPLLPSQDIIDEIDNLGSNLLKTHNYKQYEISAWTNNRPSTHNLNYWQFGDYIGIGAGAHSKITHKNPFTITRTIKHKHPKAYMKSLIQSQTKVPSNEIILEYLINHFRIPSPLSYDTFFKRTQIPIDNLKEALQKASNLNLLHINKDNIELTNAGFRYHNDILLTLTDHKSIDG